MITFIKNNFMKLSIPIVNISRHNTPKYATEGSAGLDLTAYINQSVILKPMERKLIPTGLSIALPLGYEAQIRPRSGLAYKNGITVLNSPGTIDADYRGDIGVLLINLSNEDFTINDGDRIAQMIIAKHEIAQWELADELPTTQRASGGFGSTGK